MVGWIHKAVFLCFILTGCFVDVRAQKYYMDQPSACGQKIRVGGNYIEINGRSEVAVVNPPTSCVMYLETDSTDSKYKLEVTVQSVSIDDCAINLIIYDTQSEFGQYLRSIGCSSKSTDTLYSSGRFITLKLTRPLNLYKPGYDFTLRIRAYSNDDVEGGFSRVNKIGVEVIIPAIIGVLLLIFVVIILCCCYRQGKLPGMHGRKPRKQMSGSRTSLDNSHNEKKQNGGLDNPVVSVTPGGSRKVTSERTGFDPQNPIVWSTLTSREVGRDPVTGRQRGRSSMFSQGSAVPPAPPLDESSRTGQPGDPRTETQRSNVMSSFSSEGSKRMYRKNDNSKPGLRDSDIERGNVDSYLENKGVKIGLYPDDSIKRRNPGGQGDQNRGSRTGDQGRKRGLYAEAQEKSRDLYAAGDPYKRGSYAEAQTGNRRSFTEDGTRGRGSYAEAQGRSRGSYADDEGRQRGSYSERNGTGHNSRRDERTGEADSGKIKGRKGTSPSRRSPSPGNRGNSPSRRGTSPNRQGSSSPGRRRSPGEKRRSRDYESRDVSNADAPREGKLKRPSSGFFDNPDEEGYIYSYDHLYPEGDGNASGSTQAGESPDVPRQQGRRGSAAVEFQEDEDGYLLVHNDSKSKPHGQSTEQRSQRAAQKSDAKPSISDGTSYETIEMKPNAPNAKVSSKNTNKTQGKPDKDGRNNKDIDSSSPDRKQRKIPEVEDNFDKNERYSSYDELSEPNETETISNPLHANPAVKTRLDNSRPLGDAESQPARKKKGKKATDDDMSETGSVRYGIPPSARHGNQDPRSRIDSYPYTVGPSAAYNTLVPRTTESMGPHGQSFISAFENQAPSTHSSPAHVAGKAAWYVQTTPSRTGPVTHGAFVMQTTSRQPSQEEMNRQSAYTPHGEPKRRFPDRIPSDQPAHQRPLHPSSSSTPYSRHPPPDFNSHQHFSPIEKADRTPDGYPRGHYPQDMGYGGYPARNVPNQNVPNSFPENVSDPRTTLVRSNPNASSRYVEPGTSIFDEPGHRAAVLRSGKDPLTGNEVNQVVWTDTIPDPTDPPGPNPAVTRKTITRITTRAGHGDIPDPDSMTSQLSFQTYADKLSAPQPNDPAFLSPSTTHQRYGGQAGVPEPTQGQEYPEDSNIAFYLGLQSQSRNGSTPGSRVHQAQTRNYAIRDKISVPTESLA